ncbi:MAG: pseudouridine synthase [Butyrivibrio sp.]
MEYDTGIRINKYLSMSGYCSRRAADTLVEQGRVTVDKTIAVTGTKVMPGQQVVADGHPVKLPGQYRVFAFYKPVGYISSLSDEQGEGIGKFIPDSLRLFPVGRLDRDSEGLMLLTNDGQLMNSVLKASEQHEKEYMVQVDRDITGEFLKQMSSGVLITDRAKGIKVRTAPCRTERIDNRHFKIILIQGLNRQIRRMCGSFGYKVTRLQRIRIMNIVSEGLKPGDIMEITGEDLSQLRRMAGMGNE